VVNLGLALIVAGILAGAGFVRVVVLEEDRRPDLSPESQRPLPASGRLTAAAAGLLVVAGVALLCWHVLRLWGLFSG
jgi:hypothetical protein